MPLGPDEVGEVLSIPAVSITEFAHALLKGQGQNVGAVWHVYSALNGWAPGYDVILYTSYGNTKRTAYLWYERGSLQVRTTSGWFDDANPPPPKKAKPGTERMIAQMFPEEEKT